MIPVHDLAVGTDDGGAEIVGDHSSVGFEGECEKIGDAGQVLSVGSGEFPPAEKRGLVSVGYRVAVVPKNLGGIVLGIETDAQQVGSGQGGFASSCL